MTEKEFRNSCMICGMKFDGNNLHANRVEHGMHITHHMTKKEYIIQFLFDGKIPLCKCGCGKETSPVKSFPYFREYISGHNKSTLNFKFSTESREKMKSSALKRVQIQKKENNGILPMHSNKALIKRGKIYSELYMSKKLEKYNVKLLNTYEQQKNEIYEFECLVCKEKYIQYHNTYFICKKCHPKIKSKMEDELYYFIKNNLNLKVVKNSKKLLNGLELDLYIEDKNIAIEFDGLYYHSEISGKKDKEYHINKTDLCSKIGIRLIHVFEDEWVYKKEIVKSKLEHIFGKSNLQKIYARNCKIQEINNSDKSKFLEENHIQGKDNSPISVGAFCNNMLISVATFSNNRPALGYKNINKSEFELVRFCTDKNFIVIGILGKLLKEFIKKYNPSKITSYADLRWTNNNTNLYEKNKFKLIHKTVPNYWYTTYHTDRLHRFNFTKAKLVKQGYDKNLTEWKIMQSLGYDRVWDCGSLKYELIINKNGTH